MPSKTSLARCACGIGIASALLDARGGWRLLIRERHRLLLGDGGHGVAGLRLDPCVTRGPRKELGWRTGAARASGRARRVRAETLASLRTGDLACAADDRPPGTMRRRYARPGQHGKARWHAGASHVVRRDGRVMAGVPRQPSATRGSILHAAPLTWCGSCGGGVQLGRWPWVRVGVARTADRWRRQRGSTAERRGQGARRACPKCTR